MSIRVVFCIDRYTLKSMTVVFPKKGAHFETNKLLMFFIYGPPDSQLYLFLFDSLQRSSAKVSLMTVAISKITGNSLGLYLKRYAQHNKPTVTMFNIFLTLHLDHKNI